MFFLWNTIVLGMFFYWNIEVQWTVIPIFNMNQKNVIVWFLLLKPITNLTIIEDFQKNVCDTSRELLRRYRLRVVPHFSSQIVERAWKSLHARKGDTRRGERKVIIFLSPRRVSPFLAWGDFHARSRLARSTIPEEKWGTTRSLEMIVILQDVVVLNGVKVGTQESMKILEVTLDKKLTFKDHISRQLKKVYAKSAALMLIRRFQNSNWGNDESLNFLVLPHL